MNDLLNLLDITTTYELITTLLLIAVPLIFLAVYGWILTKDGSIIAIAAVSILPLTLVPLLVAYGFNEIFDATGGNAMKLGFAFAAFVNLMNLSVLVSKYASEIKNKKFDIDHVSRDHFATTLNTCIVTTIMILAVTLFLPEQIKVTLITSLITVIATLSVNHLMVRMLLRERTA